MPVLPLTPLSLTASVNLYYLREAFIVLNNEHDFFIDCGSCSTISDGSAYAFDEAPDQPFVFWHEQCEEQLHLNPDEPMPIYFGVAKEDPNDQEILDVGTKILTFLGEKGFPCDWKGRDVTSAIIDSFHETLLNFFKICLLCHSFKIGISFKTVSIVLLYFDNVKPSVIL